jgi:hypothetical protein
MNTELDQERIEKLLVAILAPIKENYERGPISAFRVYEALNTLAAAAALVIEGCDNPKAREFFEKAFKEQLDNLH